MPGAEEFEPLIVRQTTAGLTLSPSSPMGVDTLGRWVAAQATTVGSYPAVALNLIQISTGANPFDGSKLIAGYRRAISRGHSGAGGWLTPGKRQYLATGAGQITETAPSTQGTIQQVIGIAIDPDTLFVNVPSSWDIS